MAVLSAASFKELLLDETTVINDPKLNQDFDKYVLLYSNKPQNIQYWYLRRHLLMWQLRKAAELVDRQTGPDRVNASQKFRAIRQMLIDTREEIKEIDPDSQVAEVNFSTPRSTNPLVNTDCGYFDVLGWPDPDNCFWDAPIYADLR